VVDEEGHIEAAKRHGVHRQEVTRHDAGRVPAEELAQLVRDRRGAGSSPWSPRTLAIELAATRWPSPRSSPLIRW
jgi:hypothetical protein